MAKLVTDVGSVCLLVVMFWATGTLVVAAGRWPASQLPRPATTLLGMTAWMVVAFLLAATGHLARPVVLALALLLLAAGLVASAATASSRWPTGAVRVARDERPWLFALGSAAPLLVLAALFAEASLPMVVADEGAYQLTLPKLYIQHGGFRPVPFSVYAHWPLNMNMLYAVAMLLRDFVLAKLTHWLCLVLLLVAVRDFCRTRSGPLSAWVAVPLVLANPVVLFEGSLAYVDIALALFFFQAFVAYETGRRGSRVNRWLAGVFAGVACGIKLTGAFVPLVLLALAAVDAMGEPRRQRLRTLARASVPVAVPCVILALPWYIRSYLNTGNPVYPFLFGTLGGAGWNAELSAQMMTWHQSMGMGRSPIDYLLLPVRVLLHGGRGYGRFGGRLSPAWLVLVPLALRAATADGHVRRCLGVSGLYFVLWAATSQQVRFLIPIVPFLAVAAGLVLAGIVEGSRAADRRQDRSRPAVVLACVMLTAVGGLLLWHARYVLRQSPRTLATMARLSADPGVARELVPPVFRFTSERLPEDAKLVFFNMNVGFFADREYVADSMFEASQLADLLWRDPSEDGVRRSLAALDATHVLWCEHDWGVSYPQGLFALLDDPARAAPIYRSDDGRYRLYELR